MTDDELNRLVELHVFGDDLMASTDPRIDSAVCEWVHDPCETHEDRGLRLKAMRTSREAINTTLINGDRALWMWHSREGQTWQASLEAHVAAYRHPARKFTGDWNECWKIIERMEADGWNWSLSHGAEGDIVCRLWKATDVYRQTLTSAGHPSNGRRAIIEAAVKARSRG